MVSEICFTNKYGGGNRWKSVSELLKIIKALGESFID